MKKILLLISFHYSLQLNAQTCSAGGCPIADTNATGQYPSANFSTTASTWSTVSAYMNAGNYTLFNVTNGHTYEWTYCSNFGGSQSWDAELTLFNNSSGATLCYQDDCSLTGCTTAPYLQWTATFTGKVKLLTTTSGCGTNTGSPYSTLVWRDTSGTPLVQVLGVDVYSGNGTIDWDQVYNAGYTFAYAKASEGVGYTDSEYLNYAVDGVNAGLKMGAYHFARPDLNPTTAGAISEANWFLSIAAPYIIDCELPPSLDLEGSYLLSSFTSAELTAWVQNWMNTVETATGIKPVIYIGASTCAYLNPSVNVYPLWTDHLSGSSTVPPTSIGVWTDWTFNQYSWTTTVPGIAGAATDVNVFNGNPAQFDTFMGCSTLSVEGKKLKDDFALYPNPAATNFNVTYSGSNGILNMYDLNGKCVLTKNVNANASVDISMLNEGVYMVTLKTNNAFSSVKLVIAR